MNGGASLATSTEGKRPSFAISTGVVHAHTLAASVTHGQASDQYLIAKIFCKTENGELYLVLESHSSSLRAPGPLYRCLSDAPSSSQRESCGERLLVFGLEFASTLKWEWKDIYISAPPRYRATINPLNPERNRCAQLNFGGGLVKSNSRPFFVNPSLFTANGDFSRVLSLQPISCHTHPNGPTRNPYHPEMTLTFLPPFNDISRTERNVSLNSTVGVCISLGLCHESPHHDRGVHYCSFQLFRWPKPYWDSTPDLCPHRCDLDHLSTRWLSGRTVSEELHDLFSENVVRVHISFTPHPLYPDGECQELHVGYVVTQLTETINSAEVPACDFQSGSREVRHF